MILRTVRWTCLHGFQISGAFLLLLAAATARAGNEASLDELFRCSRLEASLGSGCLFSPFAAIRNRPTLNYTLSELQLGYMLTDAVWFNVMYVHGWRIDDTLGTGGANDIAINPLDNYNVFQADFNVKF